MRRGAADLLLLTTVVLWALNFTVSKYILDHGFRPVAYSSVRYVTAAVLFIALTVVVERSLAIGRRELPLIAFGMGALFVNQLAIVYALKFTTATPNALLFGTLPLFTALIASAAGTERLSRRFWGAALISFAGVALVTAGSGGGLSADVKGDALALLGALTWAGYSVAIGPLMRVYTPFRLSAVMLGGAAVLLLVAGNHQVREQDFGLGAFVWAGFAFAVLGPLVTTNVTWFTAIDRVGPSRAALFANLQPFLAAVVALVVLSESISAAEVVGGGAIAIGIALAPRRTPPATGE